MTRHDQQILFTSLAFLAVAIKDGDARTGSEQVTQLAGLLRDYCAVNVPPVGARRKKSR